MGRQYKSDSLRNDKYELIITMDDATNAETKCKSQTNAETAMNKENMCIMHVCNIVSADEFEDDDTEIDSDISLHSIDSSVRIIAYNLEDEQSSESEVKISDSIIGSNQTDSNQHEQLFLFSSIY